MNNKINSILFLLLLLTLFGCKDEPPTPPDIKGSVTLSVVDVDLVEINLKVETENINLPALLRILRDNTPVKVTSIDTSETIVTVDSLQPGKTYNFQALIYESDKEILSNVVTASTLDTTTQNFSFDFFEFGEGSTSYFNDVWVFDENNILACGDIDLPTGFTNFIQWDGNEWKARYPYITSSGIDGIWAVDTSLMYFASGNILKYQNGSFENIVVPGNWQSGQRIEKLWGSSESNIYGVGPWGTVVWYNGINWTKIDFDTQWYFYEITGNDETGEAYAVAINQFDDCIVVKLENQTVNVIYQKSLSEIKISSRTITELNNSLYAVGSDLQSTKICRLSSSGEIEILHHLSPYIGIKQSFALNKNDIFYAGDEGAEFRLVHNNGVRYKIFNLPQIDPDNRGGIHAIKDLAVSVGFTNNKAYIIKIRRLE